MRITRGEVLADLEEMRREERLKRVGGPPPPQPPTGPFGVVLSVIGVLMFVGLWLGLLGVEDWAFSEPPTSSATAPEPIPTPGTAEPRVASGEEPSAVTVALRAIQSVSTRSTVTIAALLSFGAVSLWLLELAARRSLINFMRFGMFASLGLFIDGGRNAYEALVDVDAVASAIAGALLTSACVKFFFGGFGFVKARADVRKLMDHERAAPPVAKHR